MSGSQGNPTEEKYPQAAYALGQEAAHPTQQQIRSDGEVLSYAQHGLSKREYFAGLAMQTLIACQAQGDLDGLEPHENRVNALAVKYADDLLKELVK